MKAIPGYDDYFITEDAKVISYRNKEPRELKQSYNKRYAKVNLQKGKTAPTAYVHQLMMLTFVGECPKGLEVCHNDGNKTNNSIENLRYDTRSSNILDSVKHGTHARAKLTKEDYNKIKELYASGEKTQAEIGRMFGVAQAHISRIILC